MMHSQQVSKAAAVVDEQACDASIGAERWMGTLPDCIVQPEYRHDMDCFYQTKQLQA